MTCAKTRVEAVLITRGGQRFTGTNDCRNPQPVCPRGPNSIRGDYAKCRSICDQPGHAEIQALRAAGPRAVGATVVVSHWRVCAACAEAMERAGVERVVVGASTHA